MSKQSSETPRVREGTCEAVGATYARAERGEVTPYSRGTAGFSLGKHRVCMRKAPRAEPSVGLSPWSTGRPRPLCRLSWSALPRGKRAETQSCSLTKPCPLAQIWVCQGKAVPFCNVPKGAVCSNSSLVYLPPTPQLPMPFLVQDLTEFSQPLEMGIISTIS